MQPSNNLLLQLNTEGDPADPKLNLLNENNSILSLYRNKRQVIKL